MFARQDCQATPNDDYPAMGDLDKREPGLALLDPVTDENNDHYKFQLAAYKQRCGAEPSERRLIIK